MLLCLIEGAGRVVTKDELFDRVWEGRMVSETTLTSRLRALRAALTDSGREQRVIKTLHKRGYSFVAPVVAHEPDATPGASIATDSPIVTRPAAPLRRSGSVQRGRQSELERLDAAFASARSGVRQVVFVTGEAGLGKSTLIDAFTGAVTSDARPLRVTLGQCLQHHGRGEAYLPVLEALGRLCRTADGGEVVRTLAELAPSWLFQLPDLHTGVAGSARP